MIDTGKNDETRGIDFDAFVAEGIRLSQDSTVEWRIEGCAIEAHLIQQPKPDGRTEFDIHHKDEGR